MKGCCISSFLLLLLLPPEHMLFPQFCFVIPYYKREVPSHSLGYQIEDFIYSHSFIQSKIYLSPIGTHMLRSICIYN